MSSVNTNKRGPVVNGLVLEVSDRGRSGFYAVSQRYSGARANYFSTVPESFITKHGGVVADWPKSQGGNVLLGYFMDPRVSAYVRAYYLENPVELINKFNSLVVVPGGPSRKKQVVELGALGDNLPAELFQVPTDYSDLMKNYPAVKSAATRTMKVTVAGSMTQWSQLLKDYGISGAQVWQALGGTLADQTFVLSLRTLGYNEAKAALAGRGLDLDLDGAQRIQAA